ncbi:MAG TPA: methionyl-tRNA formyltransferase [Candidatus Saccharimonadales bacterium]|jgi:methionyl-tRNA formyltransferase|nr:methionyl-tRNA formyltransferase [Candidatus Saccharimonadales bacterium]
MSKKILFFGNERLATGVATAAPVLQGLIEAGFEVAALVIAQSEPGQSRQPRQLEVAALAERHNIPVLALENLAESADQLRSFGAEAAVLVAYGKLVPPDIINLFPSGIINVHPSLLPQFRGSTPLESVILDGALETGVSLMRLVAEMDAGPLFAQQKVPLTGRETKQELADKLSKIGSEMVLQNLPKILDGSLRPQPQSGEPTLSQQIEKQDGRLDFAKPAIRLEREVRAYAGWPRSHTTIGKTEVIITKAHVTEGQGPAGKTWQEGRQFGIYTTPGILVIDHLIPAGKKEMPAAAFLAGHSIS